jgi:hypothetical protein
MTMSTARHVISAGAALLVLGIAAAPASATRVRPADAKTPLGTERLSNERTITRSAHPMYRAAIRRRPATGSRRIGRLRMVTEDGYPEVYLTLSSREVAEGEVWIKLRIPARPNGQKGWVPKEALGSLHVVRTALLVDLRRSRATLRRDGKRVWRAPIGHGAPGTPTPRGRFYIREKLRNAGGDPIYGPWAFGTSAYSSLSDWPGGGVVGMHGTNQPALIPGRPSHGCIRVRNAAIVRLARLMPVGTPVRIR